MDELGNLSDALLPPANVCLRWEIRQNGSTGCAAWMWRGEGAPTGVSRGSESSTEQSDGGVRPASDSADAINRMTVGRSLFPRAPSLKK